MFMATYGISLDALQHVLDKEKLKDLTYFQPHADILKKMEREKVWTVTQFAKDLSDALGRKVYANDVRRISIRRLRYGIIRMKELGREYWLSKRTKSLVLYYTLDSTDEDIDLYLQVYRAEDRARYDDDLNAQERKYADPEIVEKHLTKVQLAAKKAAVNAEKQFEDQVLPGSKIVSMSSLSGKIEGIIQNIRRIKQNLERFSRKDIRYYERVYALQKQRENLLGCLGKLTGEEARRKLEFLKREGILE
jgi:hypothetical protein